MKRLVLGAAIVGLMAAGGAQADVAPPKGQKRVTLDHKIEVSKDFADWAFFTVVGGGVDAKVTQMKPEKDAFTIGGEGRGGVLRLCTLVAVPKDTVKQYTDEKELHAAVRGGKATGLAKAKMNFDPFTVVKDSDTRKVIVETYKVEKIDAKDGIVLKKVETPKDKQEEEPQVAAFPWMAAGLAGAGVFAFAGLWLARRTRR